MSDLPDKTLFTIPEVAKVLRISPGSAYDLARRGELPIIRLGRTIRVPRQRFLEWLDGR